MVNFSAVLNSIKHRTIVLMAALLWMAAPWTSVTAGDAANQIKQMSASETQVDFLPVDEAFKLDVSTLDAIAIVKFTITDGYYLYRDRFQFSADKAELGKVDFPAGETKNDEYLGEQVVYHHFVELHVPFSKAQGGFALDVMFQGCAEKGLCYPPTKRTVNLTFNSTDGVNTGAAPLVSANAPADNTPVTGTSSENSQDRLTRWLSGNLLYALLMFFLIGITLTFTPCVLPMIPITLGVMSAQGKAGGKRAFWLIFAYVQAMAFTYAILGLIVASAGAAVQGELQSPVILIGAALLFVLLSLSMFGAYELQLPEFIRDRFANGKTDSGSMVGVIVMGMLSALVVSPCISAPLAGALLYIAHSGAPLRGALILYALGLGMGVPLLIAGLLGNQVLPRAGAWMDRVKHLFGFGLLAVAVIIVNRMVNAETALLLWATLSFALACWVQIIAEASQSAWRYFITALRYMLLAYGLLLTIGALTGADDPLQPLANFSGSPGNTSGPSTATRNKIDHGPFMLVKSSADLHREIAQANAAGKTVMLDFYADWCVACFEFAKKTFPVASVQQALANTVLLQANVTDNDDTDRALLQEFAIQGLPSILFFDRDGKELTGSRVTGFMAAEDFAAHLNRILK